MRINNKNPFSKPMTTRHGEAIENKRWIPHSIIERMRDMERMLRGRMDDEKRYCGLDYHAYGNAAHEIRKKISEIWMLNWELIRARKYYKGEALEEFDRKHFWDKEEAELVEKGKLK